MADFKTHVTVVAILSAPLAASAFIMGFAKTLATWLVQELKAFPSLWS